MRILFLLTQDLHSPSGLGRYWPLARQLSLAGQQVTVAALHPDYDHLTTKQETIDGVMINYLAPMHVVKRGDGKEYYHTNQLIKVTYQATWRLTGAGLQTSADLIHIGKPHPMNSLAAMAARFLSGRHIYLDCDDYETGSGRFSSGWQQSIVAGFEKWTPHRVRAITTNTYFLQNKLISWGIAPERIQYLPNGIDRDRFSQTYPDQAARIKSELKLEGRPTIAYIGSLSLPSHPVDLLLEAFSILLRSQPNAILLLVGGGEDINTLKQIATRLGIEQAVRFVGRVAPGDVPAYYSIADVSVDPVHDNEAARGRCPLKLFESWACEVPFVTADVGDRRSLLGDPPGGLLAQPGDPESLAEAIIRIFGEPGLGIKLAQIGKTRVEKFFWDILTHDLLDFYLTHESRLT